MRGEPQAEQHGGGERAHRHRVRRPVTGVRHDQTGQRGARDRPDLPAQRVQGGRRRLLLVRHDPGHQGVQRGPLEPGQGGDPAGHHVQRPQQRLREQRVHQQDRGEHAEPRLGEQDDPAPVHGIGERPAVQPEDHQRHQLHRPHRADRERRAGEVLDLERQRDEGHEAAEVRDQPLDPQQPEVGRGTPRREVRQQGAEPRRGRRGGEAGGASVTKGHDRYSGVLRANRFPRRPYGGGVRVVRRAGSGRTVGGIEPCGGRDRASGGGIPGPTWQ